MESMEKREALRQTGKAEILASFGHSSSFSGLCPRRPEKC